MSVGHKTRKEMRKCLIMWALGVTCRAVWVSNVPSQWWSANHGLACTSKSRASRSREMIAPLCLAAVKPHLCPLSKNWFSFEFRRRQWQSKAEGIEGVPEGAEATGLVQPAEGRGKENLNAVLHLKEKEERARVFSEIHCKRLKLQQWQVTARKISIWNKKMFFVGRSIKHYQETGSWFPRGAVESPCLEIFKTQLLRVLGNLG